MYTAQSFQNKTNPYVVNQISIASPQQLIMKVYDFAILNCQKNDMVKTNEALQVLINALNFEEPAANEISFGLLKLYQYCQDQMRKNHNQMVLKILSELRDTWQVSMNKMR
ncbi:MAG: flagellar protein FliS [Melioribacteraceae bacterium]|nr:flagellar protein FliS [Melioribacteraceae bacterium]